MRKINNPKRLYLCYNAAKPFVLKVRRLPSYCSANYITYQVPKMDIRKASATAGTSMPRS
jgi:hypothetical protein